jgi:hypothetical protein
VNNDAWFLLIFIGGVAICAGWMALDEYRIKQAAKPKPRHLRIITKKEINDN